MTENTPHTRLRERLVGLRPDDPRMRFATGLATTVVVLSLLTLVYMGRAITDCSSTVLGVPGDGTSGAVWLNWAWGRNGNGPFAATQHLTGGGIGDALWQPVMIVNSGWSLPMYVLGQIFGPVCGYNLVIAFGFVSTGVGMWLLAHYLTRSRLVSLLAAVTYAFSGFTQEKAGAHVSGVMLAYFPVLVLALLWLWRRPSLRRAALVALPWAALAYVDGYYLAFSFVLVFGMLVGTAAAVVVRHPKTARWPDVWRTTRWTVIAGLGTLVLLIPFAWITLSDQTAINAERERTLAETVRFSARPLEYLVPPDSNPLFDFWSAPWRRANLHASNFVETTIYLGWVPLSLAAFAVVGAIVRHRRTRRVLVDPSGEVFVPVAALLGCGLVAFVCSLSPQFQILGVDVVMPSRIIRSVLPQMRVFSRLFVVVHSAVVALAAIGAARLLVMVSRSSWRRLATLVVAMACLAESLTGKLGSPEVWSYRQTPEVYRTLGDDESVSLVVRYPIATLDEQDKLIYSFQPEMDKPMLNALSDSASSDDAADITRGLAALTDPQTVPALRALGVDTIVVEVQSQGEVSPDAARGLGLDPRGTFRYATDSGVQSVGDGETQLPYLSRYYDTDVYTVGPGPVAPAVLALSDGFLDFVADGWSGTRWMERDATVLVHGLDAGVETVSVSFLAEAFGEQRRLEIYDGDTMIATTDVGVEGSMVSFDAPVGRALRLHSVEPATTISAIRPETNDARKVAFNLSQIDVQVVER